MKTTISLNDFQNAFDRMRPDNFSYEGLGLLFDYFEDVDPDMELDVIAICCEYNEDTFEGIAANYEVDLTGVDKTDIPQAVMDFLCDNTSVVGETADGFVYLTF
jgi:hypothetical protein